jgi:pyrimidine operon attenuation protein/uracil phosphoribosyltransferase
LDDFRRTDKPLEANETKINFIVENKKVLMMFWDKYSLCLDRYSIFGRPSEIELLVLPVGSVA